MVDFITVVHCIFQKDHSNITNATCSSFQVTPKKRCICFLHLHLNRLLTVTEVTM